VKLHLLIILLFGCSYCFSQDIVAKDTSSSNNIVQPVVNKDAIKLWPNPAVSDVYITIKQAGVLIKTIFIYDQSGNKLLEKKINSILGVPIKISVAAFPPGNYFLIAETNRQPVRLQLLKN
jgi:Secretion system C-terminal sorting domain